ncbi:hypothetical protein K7X08_010522 [Anisodus acutangulus]|uniref:Uncharacterized protein n=1 Tax=Anisodus acutangulus TaxID=402998 RepID=A0A9Q1RV78_9SOLA|nr:hypothetical protein K7X08_010522 [Anisodus acutangulus]
MRSDNMSKGERENRDIHALMAKEMIPPSHQLQINISLVDLTEEEQGDPTTEPTYHYKDNPGNQGETSKPWVETSFRKNQERVNTPARKEITLSATGQQNKKNHTLKDNNHTRGEDIQDNGISNDKQGTSSQEEQGKTSPAEKKTLKKSLDGTAAETQGHIGPVESVDTRTSAVVDNDIKGDKRNDVDKGKSIKANDNEVCNKNNFDVLNQYIKEEKGENLESNRNKEGSNANKDIVVEDSTTAKAIDAPINNAADVGVTNDVTVEHVHNKEIEEEYIVEIEGGIDNNVEEYIGVGTKQGEEAPITEESQLSKELEYVSTIKKLVERAFTANGNNMEDHDKNQELCVSDVQHDGAVPVEDMHKTELHSIAAEPT